MALKLSAEPTFKAPVNIPIAGEDPEPVVFTFKARKSSELSQFKDWVKGKANIDTVEACVIGWALTDEFTKANIERLLDNYPGAARAILDTYLSELYGYRLGN